MGLDRYQRKRKFDRTPEPKGADQPRHGGALRFVVQKHDASRLHYDFRLELGGVMLSWAIPKGPSLKPSERRLAVHVEDHPLEYRTFEGIIPAGNYGAGTVMVWDQGTYEPVPAGARNDNERTLLADFDKGHLRFVLHGQKLRGRFALVRNSRGKANEWLLLKANDPFATSSDVTEQDRSAVTGRTLAEIADQAPAAGHVWQSSRPGDKKEVARAVGANGPVAFPVSGEKRAPFPHRIKPMLATAVDKPFDDPGWWFEVKWDGFRALAEIEGGAVRLYSRKGLSYEVTFRPVVEALRSLGHDAVLDGELVVLDAQGRSHFQDLQNYQKSGAGTLAYYVFDLLYLDGVDLRGGPLRRRKELLQPLLAGLPMVRYSDHVEGQGVAFFQAAAAQGLEGMIGKKAASVYRAGKRSQEWIKCKVRQRQEAVIAGFTKPRGSRTGLGALILGLYENGELRHIGRVGSGFTQATLDDAYSRLQPLVRPTCPFKTRPKTDMPATWVEPRLVCEVFFQERTADGTLRFPIFIGLRDDKPASAVRTEAAKPAEAVVDPSPKGAGRATEAASKPASTQAFTNRGKVYWPDEGYTKGDLLDYYRDAASFILPYLKDRPLSLNRHPDGIKGKNFFHKNVRALHLPAFVTTVQVWSESSASEKKQIVCQNVETLLYVANLGSIEMNPWFSRVQALDRPDFLVIDIDPQDAPLTDAVAAAQAVRKLLEKECAECYCKTSGKRGLHVAVPLGARYDFDHAKPFAELIANVIHARLPDTTSVLRDPARRRGKVYLDFLQNRRAQTLAAPYSVRPWPGATVSTPLKWSEVTKRLDPSRFTIKTMRRRLDKVGDLWQPVLGPGFDLAKCLAGIRA